MAVYTPPSRLAIEALVVAFGLVLLYFVVHQIFMHMLGKVAMTNHALVAVQLAIAGAAFHVLFEYSGANEWYCKQRP